MTIDLLFHGVLLTRKMRTYSTASLKPRLSHRQVTKSVAFRNEPFRESSAGILSYLTVGLFTNVVAKWPGSTHDSFVFTNSLIHERLESNHAFEDGYLLGDSGYPCKPFLMTPYPNTANAKEEAFNKAHCKTRVAIEQTFGRWKRRFHLLHSECRMKPEKVCTLIGACAVLHNISIRLNDDIDDDPFDDDQPELVPYHGPDQGRLLRDHICNTFF